MNNYFNTYIILLLLASPLSASDIFLPEINQEMKNFAKEVANSNARVKAFNVKKPSINGQLRNRIKALEKQVDKDSKNHRLSVQNLMLRTVKNKSWKTKQAQLIRGLKKNLNIQEQEESTVSGHRLYLFVSSSMPKKKMRTYARQLQKYPNAQMIIRGFIGGGEKMQPTMAYIKSIITKDENCGRGVACKTYKTRINIDPVLFQRYTINKVPTLVYVDELSGGNYCSEGNIEVVNASGVHKFIGLAPFKYMIQALSEKTDLSKLKHLLEIR
ncbi:TrbC family F-type conjugative pilus assembly protein [Bathymodiolus thermophilus thioautotrophic gill symbiont]|uniref:Type-F conjugative transfer system pilin assembly protein TrbC n=1 Tax=Bathymodiolus thermophilus thioautotrophic gill symbiont TaxID=2360 RepID=A0A1J5UN36_9GAMM|nr:TrbC family F-type conjugative pilus assembly protein [Bathymodiolus thermophilus thioautotrophic gill symbiont]OIR25639.1 hypothetical protein BGC33_13775 [Bathymodiolus thermophilus thioautotrophic gill symbiont]